MKNVLISLIALSLLLPACSYAQVNVARNIIRADIEMVWEAHSYIPPLYKGKALYPVGGEVTVLALAPASLGNPSNLSYTWKNDGIIDAAQSGVGRRSYTFSGSQFGQSPLVTVEVVGDNTQSFGAVRIEQSEPKIRLYENRPLQGIVFDRALPRSLSTRESELGIEAYPLYFAAESRNDAALWYAWNANGRGLEEALGPSLLVQSEEPTSVSVQLSLSHVESVLQRGVESVTVSFE